MSDRDLIEIIESCLALDIIAYKTYLRIAQATVAGDLKAFWAEMAREEKEHADYWTTALRLAQENRIPQLFDDPAKIKAELHGIQDKIGELLKTDLDPLNLTDTFLLACRMEFYMNHSTFHILLEFVNSVDRKADIEGYYEQHINKFVNALTAFGASSPALEVLGASLKHLRLENRTLSTQSELDELTGIRNRRSFLEIIGKFGSLAKRNRFPIGVMMADIDHFKNVNDMHGHVQGDRVIRQVARVLQEHLRPSDVVGRYGGEEFVAFLSQVEEHDAFLVGEKLRRAVEQKPVDGIGVTISVGMCCGSFEVHEDVPAALSAFIEAADACLYEAKNSGRNRVVVTTRQEAPDPAR